MKELTDSNNEQYHANRTHLSSSMLKLLLKDPQQFYREWVLGQRNEEYNPAFLEGSLTHTLCLEPEKISDYAVFPGARRYGKAFEEFKNTTNKEIITANQLENAQKYTKACHDQPTAMHLLSGGAAEFTMTGEILGLPMKARADYINIERDYIVDIKTTSRPCDKELFRRTCDDYDYGLSAALYCAIANQLYDRCFDFYWIVISKSTLSCEVYKASGDTLRAGMLMVSHAVRQYNLCLTSGSWEKHAQPAPQEEELYKIEVI